MGSSQWPLMEISRRVKDDPQANRLLEEFFDACFASVPAPSWAPLQTTPEGGAERIAGTLGALNAWLRSRDPDAEELLPPVETPLEDWAEEIALQFLTNSPC
jgi:hypothetical protein